MKNLISLFVPEECLVSFAKHNSQNLNEYNVPHNGLFDSGILLSLTIGAEHMRDSKSLVDILEKQKAAGKKYAAVCAAPAVVLASNGLLEDPGATCYPAPQFREKLADPTDDKVAVTGAVTTSQGPGTSLLFALELGEQLFGKETRDKIQKEMLL